MRYASSGNLSLNNKEEAARAELKRQVYPTTPVLPLVRTVTVLRLKGWLHSRSADQAGFKRHTEGPAFGSGLQN